MTEACRHVEAGRTVKANQRAKGAGESSPSSTACSWSSSLTTLPTCQLVTLIRHKVTEVTSKANTDPKRLLVRDSTVTNRAFHRWQKPPDNPSHQAWSASSAGSETPKCSSVTNPKRDIPSPPQISHCYSKGLIRHPRQLAVTDGFLEHLCYQTFKEVRCIAEGRDLKTLILLFNHKISFYFALYRCGVGWVEENTEKWPDITIHNL